MKFWFWMFVLFGGIAVLDGCTPPGKAICEFERGHAACVDWRD